MKKKWIFMGPLFLLAFAAFVALGGIVVMQLWNWLLPPLFGFRLVNFWQGLGLLALCRILFGGLGCHNSSGSNFRRRKPKHWDSMTPEERERFRQGMQGRCSTQPAAGEGAQI